MKRLRFLWLSMFVVLGTLSNVPTRGADKVKDAESATHGFEAASYQVVDSYQFPEVKVIQFELGVLSHYSYLLVSGKEAWVVDPGRDTNVYLEAAQKEGVTITGVWLSHSHADFVAGHVELASRLKIPIYASEKTAPLYPAKLLKEGDRQPVGDAVLEFLETPGHTPDSMCALLYSRQNPQQPLAVLSGDTLFIGSVGRPDLLGEGMSAATLASMMFDTWTQKLSKLPDSVMVFPAHGAGSLCGAHLSDEPTSTLGEQRVSNPYLAHKNRGEFIAAVLDGLPEAPQYFKHNAKLNHDGPEVVDWEPKQLPWVEPSQDLTDPAKHYVVDIRDAVGLFRRAYSQLGCHRSARPARNVGGYHGAVGGQVGPRGRRKRTPRGPVPAAPCRLPTATAGHHQVESGESAVGRVRVDSASETVCPNADRRVAASARRPSAVGMDGAADRHRDQHPAE